MSPRTQKLLLVLAVVLVVAVAGALMFRQLPEEVSAPLFLLVVVIEVVVAPIPGGAVGYLGAARFGFWQAWPLLYIGNVIGTVLVFFLARRYGAPVFEEQVAQKTRDRYNRLLDSHPVLLWFVYAIPVVPVDVLSVLAGLSNMRPRRFFLIALTGYIVYTAIVAAVGSTLAEFVGVTDAVSILGALFFAGLVWWLWTRNRNRRVDVSRRADG
ncbi:MAG TPA: VTT domain-containing protein [Longimicrobiales bacterium]|nr:VTT domain-containing protein [Longimicrobiales bacterium]